MYIIKVIELSTKTRHVTCLREKKDRGMAESYLYRFYRKMVRTCEVDTLR